MVTNVLGRVGSKGGREGGREKGRVSPCQLLSLFSPLSCTFSVCIIHLGFPSSVHAVPYLAVLHKLLLVPVVPRAGVADDLVLVVQVHLLDGLLQLLLCIASHEEGGRRGM